MSELTNILKALSDETRYKLVELLLKHDFCVRALATCLNISESAVSQHLKILRDAGMVRGDKRGYYTHYYVDRERLRQAGDQILELSKIIPLDNKFHNGCLTDKGYCSGKEVNQNVS